MQLFLIIFSFIFLTGCAGGNSARLNNAMQNENSRPAYAAGKFYPASKDILKKEIAALLKSENVVPDEKIVALVVPHAGYQYAGKVMANGFSRIRDRKIKTVVIIGNSHHAFFDGVSVYAEGDYETPLGKVKIDEDLAKVILENQEKIFVDVNSHKEEHSIEAQLPFLQVVLKDFKILPLLMGNDLMENCELLSGVLKNALNGRNDYLILASSDMSHYPPYDAAVSVDNEVLQMIKIGDALRLENLLLDLETRMIPNGVSFLCGAGAVKTVMILANDLGAKKMEILKYMNSGDVINDRAGVVGYGAVSFALPGDAKEETSVSEVKVEEFVPAAGQEAVFHDEEAKITEKDRQELLRIARSSVEAKAKGDDLPAINSSSPFLKQHLGAFVTLKKQGKLRGCIGTFEPAEPLYQVVQNMAVDAAVSDPRFVPVSPEELSELEYEVSILSPLKKINDPVKEIILGKHGVQVRQGFRSGVFLPQVALETGWDLETFMGELCAQKAGLNSEAWKNGEADVYAFTAEVVK